MKTSARLLPLVLLVAALGAAHAQSPASARAFLEKAFAAYTGPGKSFDASHSLHSSLAALMDADEKAVGTDVPASADSDLICSCQEWEGIWVSSLKTENLGPHTVQIDAIISVYKPTDRPKSDHRTLRYTLEWERGRWTFYDVADITDPAKPVSLRAEIKKDLAYYTHSAQPHR